LHDQQDELRERAKLAQAARQAAQFTQDWAVGFQPRSSDRPPAARSSSPARIARRMRAAKLTLEPPLGAASKKWARVVAKVGSKAVGAGQVRVPPPMPQDDFDRIWEGLDEAPPQQPVMRMDTFEQPRSTSLVPIADENAGLWARAIAMLRGAGLRNGEA
jgi:hypothetical protein